MITKNVKLYLGDGFPVRIPVSQYDTMWRFIFTIINGSVEWTIPTGATAVLNGRKPDGNVIAISGAIADNKVTVDATEQMTVVAGEVVCELSIMSGGAVVGTANFILAVEDAPKKDGEPISESDLSAYAEMIAAAGELVEEAREIIEQGPFLPPGGTPGQVLTKTATGETWDDVSGLPDGGSNGQVLTKTSDGATWSDVGTPTQAQTNAALADYLDEHPEAVTNIPDRIKQALLACFRKVAWVDGHGQDYYDALYDALMNKEVLSIDAVFTQGAAVIYDTDSLESLKQYLVVTATFDDTSIADVTSTAELSGSLTVGTSTITVSYGGKIDTFSVTVSVGLDSIAFGSVTYRQLFEGTYKVVNFNFNDNSYSPAYINSGNPVISGAEYSSKPYSLKAFGTTSTQIRLDGTTLTKNKYYYAAGRVRVDRYSAGKAGFMPATGEIELYQQSVTDGFVTKSSLKQFTGNTTTWQMYMGSWSSANLDCYVDDCVVVDVTNLFDNLSDAAARATAKTTMDSAYQTYISIMNNA